MSDMLFLDLNSMAVAANQKKRDEPATKKVSVAAKPKKLKTTPVLQAAVGPRHLSLLSAEENEGNIERLAVKLLLLCEYGLGKEPESAELLAGAKRHVRATGVQAYPEKYGFCDDITEEREELLNIWSFVFGDTLYGSIIASLHGGASAAVDSTCCDVKNISDLKTISDFFKAHFYLLPRGAEAVEEEVRNGQSAHFPTFLCVLEYVRDRLRLRVDNFELLVAIVIWHYRLDFKRWRIRNDQPEPVVATGKSRASVTPVVKQFTPLSLSSLLVSVEFVDKTNTLEEASFPETTDASEEWLRAICQAAETVNCFKRRECGSAAAVNAWECQFTGMTACLSQARAYFKDVTTTCGADAWGKGVLTAKEVYSLYAGASEEAVDFTDASISGARLSIAAYKNNFTWMFVAAAVVAVMEIGACDGEEGGGMLKAVGLVLDGGGKCWEDVRIPRGMAVETVSAEGCLDEDDVPEGVSIIRACTSDTAPLMALQALLYKNKDATVEATMLSTWTCTYGPWVADENVFFEESPFAPPETVFASKTKHVGSVLRALNELFVADPTPGVIRATVTASALLQMEVNGMFNFGGCVLRSSLAAALRKNLADCPFASCYYVMEGSFVTHASSALWAWMFSRLERTGAMGGCGPQMMALACQACVQYPELEQLALWSCFVRLCRKPSVPVLLPVMRRNGGEPTPSSLLGKLSCVLATNTACRATFEKFSCDEDVYDAHIAYLQTQTQDRAAAALSTPCGVSEAHVRSIGHASYRIAVIERLLLRADWQGEEEEAAVRAMKCALFSSDEDLETLICCKKKTKPRAGLGLLAPHVGFEEDTLALACYIETLTAAVDATACGTVRQANAVLHYLRPVKLLETIINHLSTTCVQWKTDIKK